MITTETISRIFQDGAFETLLSAEVEQSEAIFYFGGTIPQKSLGLIVSSRVTINDDFAEASSLYLQLKDWAQVNSLNIYLLRAGSDLATRSALRTKFGLSKDVPFEVRSGAKEFEIISVNGMSRFVILRSLNSEVTPVTIECIFNWLLSMVIVTKLDFNSVSEMSKNWINVKSNSWLAFNFSNLFRDLGKTDDLMACRFFPNDNGRPAALSTVFRNVESAAPCHI